MLSAGRAYAIPEFAEHNPTAAVYGEMGVTMRDPVSPGNEDVDIWIRFGYSFYYDAVAIYYTTDGSEPQGSYGTPIASTSVLTSAGGQINFVRNEPHSPSNIDWWKGTIPATGGANVKYKISRWYIGGGMEVFTNNTGCADGSCDDPAAPEPVFNYSVGGSTTLPWPGQGAPAANPDVGYPPVRFWKEEAIVGNNYMNVMLDRNVNCSTAWLSKPACA